MINEELLSCLKAICHFPVIYKRGKLSPIEIVKQSGYETLSGSVSAENISQYLKKEPKLIDDWLYFSEDIRHSPAWGFGQNKEDTWIVSYYDNGRMLEEYSYKDKFEACAKMIKMTMESIRANYHSS